MPALAQAGEQQKSAGLSVPPLKRERLPQSFRLLVGAVLKGRCVTGERDAAVSFVSVVIGLVLRYNGENVAIYMADMRKISHMAEECK